MSSDAFPGLFVYFPDPTPISVADLVEAARGSGWALVVSRQITDPLNFSVVERGPLVDADLIRGWRYDDPHAKEYQEAVALGDGGQLWTWAQVDRERRLGVVTVYINPYEYRPRLEGGVTGPLDDLQDSLGGDAAVLLRRAKVLYVLDPCSWDADFPFAVARWVCGLRAGIWMDSFGRTWGMSDGPLLAAGEQS